MWEILDGFEVIGNITIPKLKGNPEYSNHLPELNRGKIKIEAH